MDVGHRLLGFVAAAAVLLTVVPGLAQERDSDGTRMQARQVDVGTEHEARLDPPEQEADWRMIQLEEGHDLGLELTVETEGAEATLTLTEATGEEMSSASAGDESATIERSLGAGVFYIAVESDDTLEYQLTIE